MLYVCGTSLKFYQTDLLFVSREKLAFVVDATAAPSKSSFENAAVYLPDEYPDVPCLFLQLPVFLLFPVGLASKSP